MAPVWQAAHGGENTFRFQNWMRTECKSVPVPKRCAASNPKTFPSGAPPFLSWCNEVAVLRDEYAS